VAPPNVGGVPTILTDGVHGLLASDDDDKPIAAAVIDILERPDSARRRAAATRRTCDALDWTVVRGDWLAAYRAALGRDTNPAIAPVEAA
jgi:glycosyltransferase involved in cell wall biosynthesis